MFGVTCRICAGKNHLGIHCPYKEDRETKPARPDSIDNEETINSRVEINPTDYNRVEPCFDCRSASFSRRSYYSNYFSKRAKSPIIFQDIKHRYEDCPSLETDQSRELVKQELTLASSTTDWHLCKIQQTNSARLVCERIYKPGEEYCAKHNKTCRECGIRQNIDREGYFNHEGYCSEHQKKCLTCSARTDKEYCSQHAKECWERNCSTRISNSEINCWNHKNSCVNYWKGCYQSVPYRNSFCSICQENNWCCGKRLAKPQIHCPNCLEQQRVQAEQEKLKSLVKQWTSLANPQEVVRFSVASWNNNLATIINLVNSNYWVHLAVASGNANSKVFIYPACTTESKWGIGNARIAHSYLSDAQSEAEWLRNALEVSNNPITIVHSNAGYVRFSELVTSPYVEKEEIGFSYSEHKFFYVSCSIRTPSNLDNCFKPLDIVWVEKRDKAFGIKYFHVGIYLGDSELIHLSGDNSGACKVSWSTFLDGRTGELFRIRSIIPFKNHRDIIRHAASAVVSNYQKGKYNLANRNCEHLANMLVYGVNYSSQVYDREVELKLKLEYKLNNHKGSTICLKNEIQETDRELGSLLDKKKKDLKSVADSAYLFSGLLSLHPLVNSEEIGDTIKNGAEEELNNIDKRVKNLTRELETRYETSIEAPIKTGDCNIM